MIRGLILNNENNKVEWRRFWRLISQHIFLTAETADQEIGDISEKTNDTEEKGK